MKINHGSFIREKAIKNLPSDQEKTAEKEWFEFHEVPPALAELYHYFDKRILRYRIIIMILLAVIVALLFK